MLRGRARALVFFKDCQRINSQRSMDLCPFGACVGTLFAPSRSFFLVVVYDRVARAASLVSSPRFLAI